MSKEKGKLFDDAVVAERLSSLLSRNSGKTSQVLKSEIEGRKPELVKQKKVDFDQYEGLSTRELINLRINNYMKNAPSFVFTLIEENLPINKHININSSLFSVPKDSRQYISTKFFEFVMGLNSIPMTRDDNILLLSALDCRYRKPNCLVSKSNNVDFDLHIKENGKIKQTFSINSFTGYVNGTIQTIESLYETMKLMNGIDYSEIEICVENRRNDEGLKKCIIDDVKFGIHKLNLDYTSREALLGVVDDFVAKVQIPVLTKIKERKEIERKILFIKFRNIIEQCANLSIEQGYSTLNKAIKDEFDYMEIISNTIFGGAINTSSVDNFELLNILDNESVVDMNKVRINDEFMMTNYGKGLR